MESPDVVGVLLRKLGKHKQKPVQFLSVAKGVQRRLESSLQGKRKSRLTLIDSIRNLPTCVSPAQERLAVVSEAQQKVERRRQQLEKWKEEKEKQKKEQAVKKKIPFRTGVAPKPLKYVPPPPVPSTSGRVTRYQTRQAAKNNVSKPAPDLQPAKAAKSFAPKNASFRPPEIKNLTKVPKLVPVSKSVSKSNVVKAYNFEFNLPSNNMLKPNIESNKVTKAKQTKGKPAQTNVSVEPRITTRRNAKEQEKKSTVMKKPSQKINIASTSSTSDSDDVMLKMTVKVRTSSPRVAKSASSSSSGQMEISINTQKSRRLVKSPRKPLPVSSSSEMDIEETSKPNLKGAKSNSTEKSPILAIKTPIKHQRHERYSVTPKNPVPKSESSSEERLRSPKSDVIDLSQDEPINNRPIREERISPCVTMSRGKENARKEMKQKLKEGLLDEFDGNAEHVEHFRRQLATEVTRLTELCDSWEKIREQTVLPEHVQDEILSGVGLGRLLVSSKLQQFAELVARCARPEPGAPLVSPEDLHGFWDMVFMQIENVDMRFKRLEQRRARGWADEPQPAPARRAAKPGPTQRPAKAAAGPSRLREMIAAARKAKKESQEQRTATPEKQPEDSKTFEAGFFSVKSPVRSPASATPTNKQNLLRAVLSSEAKKASATKSSTSFAMLRASVLSKNLEDGIAPLPQTPLNPINLGATPGRSILKSSNGMTANSSKKSFKVLFGDEDTDAQKTSLPENYISEVHTDSGQCSLDVEKDAENKVTPRRKSRLSRQDAVSNDDSGVITRSRRKSLQSPHTEEKSEKNRRSSRRKPLQETDVNVQEDVEVPIRSTRRRKSNNMQGVA